ncbi:hypothetical protein MKK75_03360 [Methylobacterium sp. J-030]|uniref:hypothetical protein n=1 Tax=Methylobacterium sp. J-030 TaxID=2836627 RepID=UPI001FBA5292|nr:hypothetical protein [Methylobacterium sp. J-030]MCJ2067855.1 hypothetical protein [Methylobacterium sp. J-030]
MKKMICFLFASVGSMASMSAFADQYTVEIPQPVETYTICRHGALLAVNDRAIPVSSGGRTYVEAGNVATISRSPDVFIQSERVIRNSYTSLSASGRCR